MKRSRWAKWLNMLLCLSLVMAVCAGCGGTGGEGTSSSAASETASSKAPDSSVTVADVSDVKWEAVGMMSQQMLDNKIDAGEGCQWTLSVCYSYSDPSVCFFGTDVGGIYRSTDAGSNWEPCTVGIVAAGGRGIAVDPKNTNRVLVVGANGGSTSQEECGLYLSTNMGDTFHQVQKSRINGWRDNRVQIVYDPTSFDAGKGYCTTVYWSRETMAYENSSYTGYTGDAEVTPALFKSTDGGETWETVNTSADIGGAQLAVDPKDGTLLAAGANGLFRSTDGGKTFTKVLSERTTCVTTCMTKPGSAWATCPDGVYYSSNSGASFHKISQSGYPKAESYPSHISVSPADPSFMMLATDQQTWKFATGQAKNFSGDCDYYFSHDGGKTWTKSVTSRENSFYAKVNHQSHIALHPTDKNQVLALGGDVILRSFDGGKTFVEAAAGYNGGCWTSFSINVNHPELMALSNQDYSGAYTTDGGKTWISVFRTANRLTRYTYGCYPVDKDTVLFVARDDNNQYKLGSGKYVIVRSTDGGVTFAPCGVALSGKAFMTGAVGNDNIVFANNYRSTDKGATWTEMADCDCVRTYDPATGTLYGTKSYKLVKSTDQGATWETVCAITADGTITDLAFCAADQSIWASVDNGIAFHIVDGAATPVALNKAVGIDIGSMTLNAVACDPESNTIYFGARFRTETEKGGIFRSTDGGKTWGLISKTTENDVTGDGVSASGVLRCHPTTRYLYTIGSCRGCWRVAPPAE